MRKRCQLTNVDVDVDRDKTVYYTTHKTAINQPIDHTGEINTRFM